MISLFPFQVTAERRQYEALLKYQRAINTSKTGRGKTYMAAYTAFRLGLPVLVICPIAVFTSWRRALELAEVPIEGIINWQSLKTGNTPWWDPNKAVGKDNYGMWKFSRKVLVIWDEVHAGTTGADSQTTEMLAKLRAFPIPKLLMSATLATTPLAMRGIGYLCGISPWQEDQFYRWCTDLGCVRKKFPTRDGGRWAVVLPDDHRGPGVMARLNASLKDYIVSIDEDAPDFPQTTITAKLYDADEEGTEEVRKLYQEVAKTVRDRSSDPLAMATRARQRSEILKVPIFETLANEVVAEGGSAVIFVNYRYTMELLEKVLGAKRICQIHGDIKDRQNQIDTFQKNQRHIMVAQVQAGGVGVNLHDELHARPRTSFLSPSFSAVDMVQCLGRVQRSGGTPSFQQFVLLANTLEERIYEAILRKQQNIEALTTGELLGTE